jgi:hypothetical protein
MTGGHSLQGLMRWLNRDEWRYRFAEVYDDHLLPSSDQTDLDVEEIISVLGKDWFMSTVWGCAFEDFLTRDFDDGSIVVDDYLKRRGWKEGASTRCPSSKPGPTLKRWQTMQVQHRLLPVERWFGSALRCSINWRSSDASERVARVFAPSIGSSGYLCHGGGRPGATHSWCVW